MRLIMIIMILSSMSTVYGASDKASGGKAAFTESEEFKRLRQEGFDRLYSMDYEAARARFERMVELQPEHPAGHYYLATYRWISLLNSGRRLQTNLYNSDEFYGEQNDKVDEKVDREIRKHLARAIELAQAASKRVPQDKDALYYQGAAHGLLASYEATVARAFISALKNGNKAVDLHKKVVEIDPEYIDAYLTIGTYNYVAGSLPFFIKVLAAIGGMRGSKENGLKELFLVTERGRYARDDARVVLAALLSRENRVEDALTQLEYLSKKYPSNFILKLEMAQALVRLGRRQEGYKMFESVLESAAAGRVEDLVRFQYATALASGGEHQRALKQYQSILELKGASAEVVTRAMLRAAQQLDLLLRREEAIKLYEEVLKRPNRFNSHELAKKGIKKPYVQS